MTDTPDHTDQPADVRDLADIPAVEVISRAAVMLMSSAAEKLGLADDNPDASDRLDLDEARRVITALAGLVTARWSTSAHTPARSVRACRRFRRHSGKHPRCRIHPVSPGEKYTGPVY